MGKNISSYVLYALIAVCLVVFALFCFGGDGSVEYNGESYDSPEYTDLLLYLVYAFVFITTAVTVVSACSSFATRLSTDKRSAYTSLIMTAALSILAGITYIIGDDTPLTLIGYEGSENVGGYLKMADACLYSIYFLVFVAAIAAILNSFAKKF